MFPLLNEGMVNSIARLVQQIQRNGNHLNYRPSAAHEGERIYQIVTAHGVNTGHTVSFLAVIHTTQGYRNGDRLSIHPIPGFQPIPFYWTEVGLFSDENFVNFIRPMADTVYANGRPIRMVRYLLERGQAQHEAVRLLDNLETHFRPVLPEIIRPIAMGGRRWWF
jgi:hypothetical protein